MVFVIAALVLVVQAVLFHSVRHDDAYITFRYAQNLSMGRGIVFNPGEHIMGFSSPGHMLLSAAGYSIFGRDRLPAVMSIVGCMGWTAQGLAVFFLLRLVLPGLGAFLVSCCIAFGAVWSQRFVALETNLVAATVLWAAYFAVRGRWSTCSILAGLSVLLRPDASLLVLPMVVLCIYDLRWRSWHPMLLGSSIVVPWLIFSFMYYGSIFPHSGVSKIHSIGLLEYRTAAYYYISVNMALPSPVVHVPSFNVVPYGRDFVHYLAVLVWSCAVLGTVLLTRSCKRLGILPACFLSYLLFYLLFRARIGMEWHLYPLLLMMALFVFYLLARWIQSIAREKLRLFGYLMIFVPLICCYGARTIRSSSVIDGAYWYGARENVYRSIAAFLEKNARPEDFVLAGEVGTIAYYTDLAMVDAGKIITQDIDLEKRRYKPVWAVSVDSYPTWPCPPPPVFSSSSKRVPKGELHPKGFTRFTAQVCRLGGLNLHEP